MTNSVLAPITDFSRPNIKKVTNHPSKRMFPGMNLHHKNQIYLFGSEVLKGGNSNHDFIKPSEHHF